MNRSKFRIYLDIFLFIGFSIACIISMLIGILTSNHIIEPSIFFMLVYLINLLFYRICTEIDYEANMIMDIFLSILCILCLISTIMLTTYLIYFATQSLYYRSIEEILTSHILYATIVGSLLVLYLASDNMTTFNNLHIRKIK